MALSILLMVLDHRQIYINTVHNALSIAIAPIQYAVDWPIKAISNVRSHFSTRETLLTENQQLHQEALLLNAQLQKMHALELENSELRVLLKSPSRAAGEHVLVAQLLSVDADLLVHELVLNKGSADHIYLGQPVIDANGIMGQVIQVNLLNSRVLLVSDVRSAIPVLNKRTGMRSIVAGTGRLDRLSLINIPITADVKVGDMMISSGLGGRFPAGHPVGIVTEIKHKPGEQFASIYLKPSANLTQNEYVLLLWSSSKNLPGNH